jgi:hypothetical protein
MIGQMQAEECICGILSLYSLGHWFQQISTASATAFGGAHRAVAVAAGRTRCSQNDIVLSLQYSFDLLAHRHSLVEGLRVGTAASAAPACCRARPCTDARAKAATNSTMNALMMKIATMSLPKLEARARVPSIVLDRTAQARGWRVAGCEFQLLCEVLIRVDWWL